MYDYDTLYLFKHELTLNGKPWPQESSSSPPSLCNFNSKTSFQSAPNHPSTSISQKRKTTSKNLQLTISIHIFILSSTLPSSTSCKKKTDPYPIIQAFCPTSFPPPESWYWPLAIVPPPPRFQVGLAEAAASGSSESLRGPWRSKRPVGSVGLGSNSRKRLKIGHLKTPQSLPSFTPIFFRGNILKVVGFRQGTIWGGIPSNLEHAYVVCT